MKNVTKVIEIATVVASAAATAGTITQDNGSAHHATIVPGQTFTMPESGELNSVVIKIFDYIKCFEF